MNEVETVLAEPVATEAPVETVEVEPSIDEIIAKELGEAPPAPADDAAVDARRKEALSTDGKLDDQKLSAAFAKVREQERRAKQRAQTLESERQAILKARKEFDDREAERAPLHKLAKENPREFLEKNGWTRQQIADFLLNDEKLPPERLLEDIDARYKARQDDLDRRHQELEERIAREKTESAARQYEGVVLSHIQSNIDAYPLTKRMASRPGEDLHRATLNYLARVYKETGKALAPKAALEYFENRFTEERDALVGDSPGQTGAGKAANNLGAGQQPRPLTNGASSERAVKPPLDDADTDAVVAKLIADAERGIFPDA